MKDYLDLIVKDLENLDSYKKLNSDCQEKVKTIALFMVAIKFVNSFFDSLSDMHKKGLFKKL